MEQLLIVQILVFPWLQFWNGYKIELKIPLLLNSEKHCC